MANALCLRCNSGVHWRAVRGARLADQRCPRCGSALAGKTSGRMAVTLGRRRLRCVLCRRWGFSPGRMRIPSGPWHPRFTDGLRKPGVPRQPLPPGRPAGQAVCWHHEPTLVDPRGHRFEDAVGFIIFPDQPGVCNWCARPEGEHGQPCTNCLRPSLLCRCTAAAVSANAGVR